MKGTLAAQPLPGDGQAEARLADDYRMTIRPIEPSDKPLIVGAFAALSEESRYRRFFTSVRELDAQHLAYVTEGGPPRPRGPAGDQPA
jgi:acetyltransferase